MTTVATRLFCYLILSASVVAQTLTASITPKAVTVTVTVAAKAYDGTTAAPGATCAVVGVIAPDVVTCSAVATFTTKQAGTAKPWTAVVTKGGADAANYTVPTSATGTADITKKALTLSGLAVLDKTYDATITATVNAAAATLTGLVAGDACALDPASLSATFADKNVGVSKPVTLSGTAGLTGADCVNYTLTVSAPPPSGLLTKANLQYVGAFRLPLPTSGPQTFSFGGTALSYWPAHNSLLVVGQDALQQVGEISIPTPGTQATVASLPRAVLLQPLTDILQGQITTIDGDTANGVKVGGIIPTASKLVVSAWSYYDNKGQTKTHFVTGQTFATLGATTGPFQVGTGFQWLVPTDTFHIGGFVSGYMTAIPAAWQAALGGTRLTGQGGGVAILTRTSSGPSATVFTPADLGVTLPAPGTMVMGYPSDSGQPGSILDHPTLGRWGVDGSGLGLYNGTQIIRGMIFPEGSRSILFFGRKGSQFCYGAYTLDPTKNFAPDPNFPGEHLCYDPTFAMDTKGVHGYPYTSMVYAYDVNDFLAAKAGTKKPWEVVPYATWTFTMPFQSHMVNGVETGVFDILGATYDPATARVFVTSAFADGTAPLIHVFHVI